MQDSNRVTNWAIYPSSIKLNHAYWFRYIVTKNGVTQEIKYKMLVRYIQSETEDTSLYLLSRISEVYLNDKLPDLCMDELAYETGKVFYPMLVELDERCKWIGIRNYNQIKDKWFHKVRPKVSLRYSGKLAEDYLSQMDAVINEKESIEEIFKKEVFFQIFFDSVYQSYHPGFTMQRLMRFPIGEDGPLEYYTNCELKQNLTPQGYKEIVQSGIGFEKNTEEPDKITLKDDKDYAAHILLNSETNIIREIQAEWNIKNQEKEHIKIIVYPLRIPYTEEIEVSIDKVRSENLFYRLFFD